MTLECLIGQTQTTGQTHSRLTDRAGVKGACLLFGTGSVIRSSSRDAEGEELRNGADKNLNSAYTQSLLLAYRAFNVRNRGDASLWDRN